MLKINPLHHPICLAVPNRLTPSSAWHEHIPFAMFLVDLLRPTMIVELGTHHGDSYCAFCQAVKELRLNTRCYAIDTWQGDPHAGLYGPEVLADLCAHHDPLYGGFSCLIQSTFDAAREHFGDGTVDLLHIDGHHTYESVRHDFEAWLPTMSSHGIVLLHDTNVRECDFGIRKFWDEIKLEYPHFEFRHGHGLGVLQVGEVRSKELQELFQAPEEDRARIRDFFFHLGHGLTTRVRDEARGSQLQRQEGQLQELKASLDATDAEICSLERRRHEELAHIANLEARVRETAERERELKKLKPRVTALEARLAAVYSCHSWRITAPLRAVNRSIRWFLRNTRRAFTLLGWLGTGQFSRAGNALLPYYYRFVPMRVQEMVPHWVRGAVKRQLSVSKFPLPKKSDSRPADAVARASHRPFIGEKTVSMVVLNRDGAELLDRLLASLDSIQSSVLREIIVVDHASVDSSRDVCRRWSERLPITLLACHENYTFSYSNNRAAEIAQGSLLLFANNDVVVPSDVISRMANTLNDPAIGVVGIRQYQYLDSGEVSNDSPCHHVGVYYRPDVGQSDGVAATMFRPFNMIDDKVLPDPCSAVLRFPAATASFMMMRKADFLAVGGLAEDYDYGYEDIDLCLKVRTYLDRDVVVVNDAYVLHEDAQTRHASSQSDKRRRRITNDAALSRRFGYLMRRHYRERLIRNDATWTGRPLTVVFAVTDASLDTAAGDTFTAYELAVALRESYGWDVRLYGPQDWYRLEGVDVVVAMRDDYDPSRIETGSSGLVRVAWARNWFERWCARPWLGEFDLIWCSGLTAAQQLRELSGIPASVLLSGTNAERFMLPTTGTARDFDYVYTGNYWGVKREIEEFLFPERLPFEGAVFGKGWKDHPRLGAIYQGFKPYRQLPALYQRARVVIDDATHVTKLAGSVNSRVFDALASGALVITNGATGSREVFSGKLPVFQSASELEELLRRFLEDEAARVTLVEELRREVLSKHTYRSRAIEVRDALATYAAQAFRIAIKIAAPDRRVVEQGGDYHFALGLSRALKRRGHSVRVDVLNEWQRPESVHDDVVIVLRGLSAYHPRPDQINIMWNISHPDKIGEEEYQQFDHVFVASLQYARELATRLSVPVTPLLQCTDPARFASDPNSAELDDVPAHPVLFIGNSRHVFRTIVKDAIAAGLDIAVYGSRWRNFIAPPYLKGEHVSNFRLPVYYQRAKVVLNDHWNSMATYGFISNRIFDAGACGAAVVTDEVEGIEEVFGDAVVTYRGAADLKEKVSALLADESKRHNLGQRLQRMVLCAHTFDQRAVEILRVIQKFHALRMLGPNDPPLYTRAYTIADNLQSGLSRRSTREPENGDSKFV